MFQPFYHPLRQALINYEAPVGVSTFIKSVQVCSGTIPEGQQDFDVLISAVAPNYTAPIILGWASPNADPRNGFCICLIPDSTHVRLSRTSDQLTGALSASVFVFEFEPDFVQSNQSVNLYFEPDQVVTTINIDDVDLNKAVIFPCGKRVCSDVDVTQFNSYVEFLNSTTLQATRTSSGSFLYHRVCVMEFI